MGSLKAMSLKKKLLATIILLLVSIILILSVNLGRVLVSLKEEVVSQTGEAMEHQIQARLKSEAGSFAYKISNFINRSYQLPQTVARVLKDSMSPDRIAFDREQVNQLVSSVLEENKQVSSIYAQFEKNGYDQMDSMFVNSGAIHSVENTGTLEIYWVRNPDGSLEQQKVEDSSEKYADTRDEFGIREAEWYLCAKDSLKPCAMEPYLYEISDDYSEMMTSLTAPVVFSGAFKGLVGVDVNLPIFQKMTDELSAKLFNGQGRVTVLSSMGFVVSSSHYKDKLSRPLKESHPNYSDELLTVYQSQETVVKDGMFLVGYPINIEASNSTWSVLLEVPVDVAMASKHELTDFIADQVASIITQQMMISLIVGVVGLIVMVLLIASITKPIGQLNRAMRNLASADGDLTQTINLDTHAELIELSGNVNLFIEKLRTMINKLKTAGTNARSLSADSKEISEQTDQETSQQLGEISSVVTATNEMSATAHEVSRFATEASENASNASDEIQNSAKTLSSSVEMVKALTDDMQQASNSISQVAARSEDIHRILDVIRSIAEQTNLLALNAAIEAARAGEQGRGFAVVADEVRSLASKTQSSTEEINDMIQSLQGEVNSAVSIIESGTSKAQEAMERTQTSYESLHGVSKDIIVISDHITQVATAAEEQSSVSEEINKNLTILGEASSALSELGKRSSDISDQLQSHMDEVEHQLSQLKT
ncbi:methyl-accepting chemotaxis protein [Litoribrevibacter euphylliae]|uniref:Methyl-accepting chemotaxis protein n=1 Tax=Litoribrevibacter euphylliae TaxID=1834034 RepID=A0ABV7HFM8_9GAMM